MVTINNEISLIIDVNHLFEINDPKVQNMVSGDIYIIKELYKDNLNFIRENLHCTFTHSITNESKSLSDWMDWYRCDATNPDDIITFLRYSTLVLTIN